MSTIDDIRTRLVNKLLEQGLLFLFLGLGIWYFNGENKKLWEYSKADEEAMLADQLKQQEDERR